MNSFSDIRKSVYPCFADGEATIFTEKDSLVHALRFFKKLCRAVHNNSKLAPQALLLAEQQDFAGLLQLSANPFDYEDGEQFANDYQISAFFSKCQDLPGFGEDDRKLATLKATADAEAQNRRTTTVWKTIRPTKSVEKILWCARDIIYDIMGDAPCMDDIYENASFGPGSSSSCTGDNVSLPGKLCATMDVTEEALPFYYELISRRPEFFSGLCDQLTAPEGPQPLLEPTFNIVNHDTYIIVPKKATIGRGICIAQHGNIPLQKGAGSVLRRLLRDYKYGYCLDSQHVVNQHLAMVGSITKLLATVDVKSASDCITTVLVDFLLPRAWFDFLDALRAKETLYPCGTLHRNYKFSSMGNGYTFELESIIFFALAKATAIVENASQTDEIGRNCVFSFGDDIICPSSIVPVLEKVLAYCGFQINTTKSFYDSVKFRESCGADFWDGGNVRPFYLRKLPKDETDLIKLANAIRHYASRRLSGCGHDIRFLPLWRSVVDVLTDISPAIPVGPSSLGDQCLWAKSTELKSGAYVVRPFTFCGITYSGTLRYKGRRDKRKRTNVAVTARLIMLRQCTTVVQSNLFYRIPWFSNNKSRDYAVTETSQVTNTLRGLDERQLKRSYSPVVTGDDTLFWH